MCTPNGIRTRAATLKGWCPRPLDDGGPSTPPVESTGTLPASHRPSTSRWLFTRRSPLVRRPAAVRVKVQVSRRLRSVHDSSQHPCPSPRTRRSRRGRHPPRGPRVDRVSDDSTRLDDPGGRVGGTCRSDCRVDGPADTAGGDAAADLDALYAAAQEEGQVNLIALPDNWANYGGILQSFRDKYPGVDNPVQNPDASLGRRADRRRDAARLGHDARLDRRRPAVCPAGGRGGHLGPVHADGVGRDPRHAEGSRTATGSPPTTGSCRSARTRRSSPDAPTSFADLNDPQYAGQVALNGDPREAGRGVRRRVGRGARQRRLVRRHHARHRVLRRPQGTGHPDPHRRRRQHDPVRRDADRARLDVQLAGPPRRHRRGRLRVELGGPERRRVRLVLRPGRRRRQSRTPTPAGCGSSTSSPTRAPSATSKAARSRLATRRSSRTA